jgi:hypothetical protein
VRRPHRLQQAALAETPAGREPMTRRIVLATRNAHKVGELREILGDVLAELELDIVGMADFPDLSPTSSRTG